MSPSDVSDTAPSARLLAVRERILRGAARIFVERGFSGTKLTDIASAAGLQTGSLYYHFVDRAALVHEVTRRGVLDSVEAARKAVAECSSEATSRDRLLAAVDAHIWSILRPDSLAPAAISLLPQLPPEQRERVHQETSIFKSFWVGLGTAAAADGYLDDEVDVNLQILVIVNTLNSVISWTEAQRSNRAATTSAFRRLLEAGFLRRSKKM
ncbi:TetR/AcrR family transcriptional regulator [Nocardia sp. CA-120079]|uniref:TetR/AcrR family transcriptional regulator n=1 Tax=Nocardia sp. CA-120079 TaxID=3239974 RepID=UPI003D9714F1